MLISNLSDEILESYLDCISVFSTVNQKAFLSILRDLSSPEKYHICACLKYLCQPLKLLYNWNSNLHRVQLGSSIHFTCFTVSKLYLYQQVSVYSWNRCPPRPCPHWGQKSQGHATLNKGTHLTAISTRSNFKYIVDQHKSVSRVDRAQMKIPLPPFNKKGNKQTKNIPHTHTQTEMSPIKAD